MIPGTGNCSIHGAHHASKLNEPHSATGHPCEPPEAHEPGREDQTRRTSGAPVGHQVWRVPAEPQDARAGVAVAHETEPQGSADGAGMCGFGGVRQVKSLVIQICIGQAVRTSVMLQDQQDRRVFERFVES